jgi:chemotaxis protein methyltransferase CheR
MLLQRVIFPHRKPTRVDFEQEHTLAQAIVDTVREPLLVLDQSLRVVAASRSFYLTFRVNRQETQGRLLYTLGNGQWDIPKLRATLEAIVFSRTTIEGFEVDQFFPSIGRRVMMLNARTVYRLNSGTQQILLAIEDVTERVGLEREHAVAHQRMAMLMQELTHRVKNSLQSIAAMVMIEARGQSNSEGKAALGRVSHRIAALGQLYSKLSYSDTVDAVDAATYLEDLCRDLVASVQNVGTPSIVLKTDIARELLPIGQAIPMGLIVNELVTNALEHAFPSETKGTITVTLKRVAGELHLTVGDDGQGVDTRRADSGLGGRLVKGFAQQLDAHLERESSNQGTTFRLILPREERFQARANSSKSCNPDAAWEDERGRGIRVAASSSQPEVE